MFLLTNIIKSQEDFASIIFAQEEGEPLVASLRTQPFGPCRAPANWARVADFIKFVLGKLAGIDLRVFVDDCFLCEPSETVTSAFEMTRVNLLT